MFLSYQSFPEVDVWVPYVGIEMLVQLKRKLAWKYFLLNISFGSLKSVADSEKVKEGKVTVSQISIKPAAGVLRGFAVIMQPPAAGMQLGQLLLSCSTTLGNTRQYSTTLGNVTQCRALLWPYWASVDNTGQHSTTLDNTGQYWVTPMYYRYYNWVYSRAISDQLSPPVCGSLA